MVGWAAVASLVVVLVVALIGRQADGGPPWTAPGAALEGGFALGAPKAIQAASERVLVPLAEAPLAAASAVLASAADGDDLPAVAPPTPTPLGPPGATTSMATSPPAVAASTATNPSTRVGPVANPGGVPALPSTSVTTPATSVPPTLPDLFAPVTAPPTTTTAPTTTTSAPPSTTEPPPTTTGPPATTQPTAPPATEAPPATTEAPITTVAPASETTIAAA